jgi:CRP-like cAMP-binding protein
MEVLWQADEKVENFYIIQKGWAYTYRDNLNGERQIVDVLLPGDIAGLRDLTFARHKTAGCMLTRGAVGVFSHKCIVDLIDASTPLAIALLASISRQETMLTERMLMTIHRSARSRIAHFIVEIHTRLRRSRAIDFHQFFLPLTQAMLGEVLGLTLVHVNRTLAAMERERILIKHRQHIEIIDHAKLLDEAGFDADYLSDDLNGLREYLVATEPRR